MSIGAVYVSDYLTKFMTADDDVYDCLGKRLKLEGRRRTVSFAPRSVYIKLVKAGAPLPTSESRNSIRVPPRESLLGFLLLSSAWLVEKDS